MTMTLLVVVVVSGALLIGAAWGILGKLPDNWEGFLVALAGGALVYSLIAELIQPSIADSSLGTAMIAMTVGAVAFTLLDFLVDEKLGSTGGGGLLLAVTLDGVPENLALGVALIGAAPLEVAALAGSIFLSNLPEAAGGAKEMVSAGQGRARAFALWAAAAALLSGAAIVGNVALEGSSPELLAATRSFAAGAVVASLATEVFPKAYREGHHLAGVATVLGLVLAFVLASLGGS